MLPRCRILGIGNWALNVPLSTGPSPLCWGPVLRPVYNQAQSLRFVLHSLVLHSLCCIFFRESGGLTLAGVPGSRNLVQRVLVCCRFHGNTHTAWICQGRGCGCYDCLKPARVSVGYSHSRSCSTGRALQPDAVWAVPRTFSPAGVWRCLRTRLPPVGSGRFPHGRNRGAAGVEHPGGTLAGRLLRLRLSLA